MTLYIALLRGINVGGNNKIKMADLKQTLLELGLSRVQTYIQSGNVLFESEEPEAVLRERIEAVLHDVYGVKTAKVILRTAAELEHIVTHCPFSEEVIADAHSLHITLLDEEPNQATVSLFANCQSGNDEYRIQGREIYLLLRQSILDSPYGNLPQKIKLTSTARNWNTMNKLWALAKSMN